MARLKQLEAFITVIEQNGFAAAGLKLHVTAAAVSKQIKALEESLGMELIKRNTRNLSLTEAGDHYFSAIKKILVQLKETDLFILQTQREPAGVLKVVAGHYFATQHILPKLPLFLKKYPKLILKLELAERFPDLIREEIDLVFGINNETYPDFVHKEISKTRYVFCASPEYLQTFGTPKLPEDLKIHRYLTHSMRKKADFLRLGNHPELYIEPYLWLNDCEALRRCACEGLGIVKLHEYFVRADLTQGKLVEVYADYTKVQQSIYLCYREGRYTDSKIKAFVDFYGTYTLMEA